MTDYHKKLRENKYTGPIYKLPDTWSSVIPVSDYENKPLTYLEIGVFYGSNLITVADIYGKHKDSKLFAVDPWEGYDDYKEYENVDKDKMYNNFLSNLDTSENKEKIIVNRGYSHNEVLKFEDDFFDIVYIDGNHNSDYVLEDAVKTFRKLKKGGIMIFDDYDWNDVKTGIDAFTHAYGKKIHVYGIYNLQLFLKKL